MSVWTLSTLAIVSHIRSAVDGTVKISICSGLFAIPLNTTTHSVMVKPSLSVSVVRSNPTITSVERVQQCRPYTLLLV